MAKLFYESAYHAIRDGNHFSPCGVSYKQGRGWALYNLREGPDLHEQPEFICYRSGRIPLALTDAARTILAQLIVNVRAGEARI